MHCLGNSFTIDVAIVIATDLLLLVRVSTCTLKVKHLWSLRMYVRTLKLLFG